MKLVLQLSMFLTLFLTLFFIINFKPHPVTLVQNRIKTLRSSLFEQLYIKKSGQDRVKWILELEQRRDEIRFELKTRIKTGRNLENKIDGIIDKAWDELLAVMKSGYDLASLEDIVKARSVKIEKPKIEEMNELPAEITDELGGFEEIGSLDEKEEIEEALEISAIEEADEIQDAEEIAEAEEISDVEEAEEIGQYTEIRLSKGLLKAAIDTLEKIKKEKAKAAASEGAGKGLLNHAAEFLDSTETSAPVRRKGLLRLAIEFLTSGKKAKEEVDELEEIETLEAEQSRPKGLLAIAKNYDKQPKIEPAALATDNFSVREIDDEFEPEDDDDQEFSFEMEVVSPLSAMFSSLDNKKNSKKKKSTSLKNAD
jgi:hypothetical protein